MLDSLLTLTRRGALWMAIFFVVCVAFDRGISAITGNTVTIFALGALMILIAFVTSAGYTFGRWAWRKMRPPAPPTE